jgi:hypothetical protein
VRHDRDPGISPASLHTSASPRSLSSSNTPHAHPAAVPSAACAIGDFSLYDRRRRWTRNLFTLHLRLIVTAYSKRPLAFRNSHFSCMLKPERSEIAPSTCGLPLLLFLLLFASYVRGKGQSSTVNGPKMAMTGGYQLPLKECRMQWKNACIHSNPLYSFSFFSKSSALHFPSHNELCSIHN